MKEQKNKIKLDDLLDGTEPFANFHDATLHKLQIDYDTRDMTTEIELCIGNPDEDQETERERSRTGLLKISGLIFWALEPPSNNTNKWGSLRLTSDGLIEEATTDTARKLTSILKPEMFGWYLFFSNINAFGYLVAKEAKFEWTNA